MYSCARFVCHWSCWLPELDLTCPFGNQLGNPSSATALRIQSFGPIIGTSPTKNSVLDDIEQCQMSHLLRGRKGSLVHSTCCCVGVTLMHLKSTWSLSCWGPSGCRLPAPQAARARCGGPGYGWLNDGVNLLQDV
jgi:hypothetical protein